MKKYNCLNDQLRRIISKIKDDDTPSDMMFTWQTERKAYLELCQIYFDIASELIGDAAVREKRDKILREGI